MITRETDYAIRAMLYLAQQQHTEVVSTTMLAREMDIPYRFLRRILRRLGGVGFVASTRGARGGLRLAQPAEDISLLDIIRAVDPNTIMLNACLVDSSICQRSPTCVVHAELSGIQEDLLQRMASAKLSGLVARC